MSDVGTSRCNATLSLPNLVYSTVTADVGRDRLLVQYTRQSLLKTKHVADCGRGWAVPELREFGRKPFCPQNNQDWNRVSTVRESRQLQRHRPSP